MPDTTVYLLLGLGMTGFIMAVYLGSLVTRWRNVQKDLQLIENLREE